jgi:hypothetical protein
MKKDTAFHQTQIEGLALKLINDFGGTVGDSKKELERTEKWVKKNNIAYVASSIHQKAIEILNQL